MNDIYSKLDFALHLDGKLPTGVTSTDVDVADAVTKKHTQNTDQLLGGGGVNQVTVADVHSAVDLKHLGTREGLNVTIKDADELYVSGGSIEIGGIIYSSTVQLTKAVGTVSANTMYYIYVSAPATGTTITATEITLSTTVPLFSDLLGALYMTGDTTKRYIARYYEESN